MRKKVRFILNIYFYKMRTDAFDPETLEVRNNEMKPMIETND